MRLHPPETQGHKVRTHMTLKRCPRCGFASLLRSRLYRKGVCLTAGCNYPQKQATISKGE